MPVPAVIVMSTFVFSNPTTCVRRQAPGTRLDNGFALLEVLVALLLFSIGILGLLGLQARSITTAGDAEDRNRAALIADRCASQMQLQAPNVAITNTTATEKLAKMCQTSAWNDYIGDPMQGGLPNGVITVTPPSAYSVVEGGAPLAPLTFDITVTWAAPAEAGTPATATSRLATQVTLLVQNS
jgi:type IV pilus assembly protein PilV